MDWWQRIDLLLLLFAISYSIASLQLRLADFLNTLLLGCLSIQRLFNKTNGFYRLRSRLPHCVPFWLVWKRLNIALNYTMKPGFLFTFLLAGSTIVHACESSIYWIFVRFISYTSISYISHTVCCLIWACGVRCVQCHSVWFHIWKSNSIDARQ